MKLRPIVEESAASLAEIRPAIDAYNAAFVAFRDTPAKSTLRARGAWADYVLRRTVLASLLKGGRRRVEHAGGFYLGDPTGRRVIFEPPTAETEDAA